MAWNKDRRLDARTVKAVLVDAFPGRRFSRIKYFGEGWDNEMYEADGQWLFRFPKRRQTVSRLKKEIRLLPAFADLLDIEIPAFSLVGSPSTRFPYPFAGYRKIEGIQAFRSDPDKVERKKAAKVLGRFLSGLHSISVSPAIKRTAGTFERWDEKKELKWVLSDKKALKDILGTGFFRKLMDRFSGPLLPVPKSPKRLIHADLMPEHILLSKDGRSVVGVIDWADMVVGPTACDFTFAAAWLGNGFLLDLIDHYRGPDVSRHVPWMLQRGLIVALENIAYGRSVKKKEYIRDALRTIRNILA